MANKDKAAWVLYGLLAVMFVFVGHGRRLRALLNAAGYPAPGSVPQK